MVIARDFCWTPEDEISISFLNGTDKELNLFTQMLNEWLPFVSLKINFSQANNAEIRVSFTDNTFYSILGRQALGLIHQPRVPTLCLPSLKANNSLTAAKIILHEIGHVFSCIHEHQGPYSPILLNKDIILDRYSSYPYYYSTQLIKLNFFELRDLNLLATDFDPYSIMCYGFSPDETLDGSAWEWNNQLSELDKSTIHTIYPKPTFST